MAHPLKCMLILSVPLLFLVSCKISRTNKAIENARTDSLRCVIAFPDSLNKNSMIAPDDLLATKESMERIVGIELNHDLIKKLILADCGFFFPKGIIVNRYDLETLYLPRIKAYYIGKWNVSEAFSSFIIMCQYSDVATGTEDLSFYLVTMIGERIKGAYILANTERDVHAEALDRDSEEGIIKRCCKRLSNDSFMVYHIGKDGSIDKNYICRITEEGMVKYMGRTKQ